MASLAFDAVRVSDARTSARWILGDADLPAHLDPGRTALPVVTAQRTYADCGIGAVPLAAGLRAAGLQGRRQLGLDAAPQPG